MKKDSPEYSDCKFAAEMLDFLYGELNGERKNAFQTHLHNCSICADEIETFSDLRFSVREWKATEFDKLVTPEIQIPYNTPLTKTFETEKASWFYTVKNYFVFSPVWSGAMAVLIFALLVGFGIFVLSKKENNEFIAIKNDNTGITNNPVGSPKKNVEAVEETADKYENDLQTNDPVNRKTVRSDVEQDEPPVPVRANKNSNPKQKLQTVKTVKTKAPAIEPSLNSSKNPKVVPSRNKPRLNELPEEDEDNSLRLSDLFAELDTRE